MWYFVEYLTEYGQWECAPEGRFVSDAAAQAAAWASYGPEAIVKGF